MPLTPTQIENRVKWENALCESVKAKNALYDGVGYCCLGVALNVLGVSNNEIHGMAMPWHIGRDLTIPMGVNPQQASKFAKLNDGTFNEYGSPFSRLELSHPEISLYLSIEREAIEVGDLTPEDM